MDGQLMYRNALNQRTFTLSNRKNTFWGATFYYISRTGMERIMNYFNKKTNQFDIDQMIERYKISLECLVSDYILYKITSACILSLPVVNISSPDLLPSTIQSIDNIAPSHIPSYIFVDKYSNKIIDIIKKSNCK